AYATGVEPTIAYRRLKRWCDPLLQRIGWLDVVVPIQEHGGRTWLGSVFGKDHGAARFGHGARGQAHLAHDVRDVFRNLVNALAIRTNAWAAQIVDKPGQQQLLTLINVGKEVG